MDPHSTGTLDPNPDPHCDFVLDPDPHETDVDPKHCLPVFLKRFRKLLVQS
jgi:hypothetical protein